METASTETLFRFVTFRKPEPVKQNDIGVGFIFHPTKGAEGYFSNEITRPLANPDLQLVALKNKASEFGKRINLLDQSHLLDLVGRQRLTFSEWFSDNSINVFDKIVTPSNEQIVELLNSDALHQLWDNVFYHIITNANVTFRKKIVDLLVADYYLKYRHENAETAYLYANAKLVIPKGLFALKDDDAIVNNNLEATKVNPHFSYSNDFKTFKKGLATKDEISRYKLLETEVNKIKKLYDDAYQKEYNTALAAFNIEVNAAYASAESTIDPDTKQKVYTNLNLPTFTFEYSEPELNREILTQYLSKDSLATVEELLLLNATLFSDVFETINNKISDTSIEQPVQSITANIQARVIGNTIVTSSGANYAAGIKGAFELDFVPTTAQQLSSNTNHRFKLNLYVNVGVATKNITSAKIKCTTTNGTVLADVNSFNSIDNSTSSSSVIKSISFKSATGLLTYNFPETITDYPTVLVTGNVNLSTGEIWEFAATVNINDSIVETINGGCGTVYARGSSSGTSTSYDVLGTIEFAGVMLDRGGVATGAGSTGSGDAGSSVNACIPLNCKATMFTNLDGTQTYTITYDKATAAGVKALTLQRRYVGQTDADWAHNNTNGNGVPMPIVIRDVPAGNYEFRFVTQAEGTSCDLKVTQPFSVNSRGTGSSGTGGSGATDDSTFIPSQYGVKSLGIAEFRRVEQTLCCYEPSEVSAIENVMQGEYREKGSRKLHRTETTNTTETTTEKESLSDTVTTERFSMQNQTASVLSQSISANAHVEYNGGMVSAGAAFGFNSSKQESSSHAVNYGKDVTTRALERVVQKVREERIVKITDEFEETNKHGYDNRGGSGHISGVYRFIDKVYKNQIFNYGKRLMYEFIVPEPSKFHNEAVKSVSSGSIDSFTKPVDPRNEISSFNNIDLNWIYKWASIFNIKIDELPQTNVKQTLIYSSGQWGGGTWEVHSNGSNNSPAGEQIKLPKNYYTKSASVVYTAGNDNDHTQGHFASLVLGNNIFECISSYDSRNNIGYPNAQNINLDYYENEIPLKLLFINFIIVSINITLELELKPQVLNVWKNEAFNKIITAYEDKLREYNDAVNAARSTSEQKATNPLFYRQIENICLKKNCMDYLVGSKNLGKNFYKGSGIGINGVSIDTSLGQQMEQYANLSRFLEEAFDWDIMSYKFYPFYWGSDADWAAMYKIESDDPLFANFMQAGMSRVVVPVKPGFESAVMFYMATGKVWNGTDKILLDLDLHKTVEYEMANQEYTIEKTWETKVPSSLTMIQEGSVGLPRPQNGLPCDCGDTKYTEGSVLTPPKSN